MDVIQNNAPGNQGNPSIGLDADGDVFIAFQGFDVMDIQSIMKPWTELDYLGYAADSEELAIQLSWSDFDKANLVYENKAIYYGDKIAYEDKNEDLAKFVKLALGWGYDEYGDLVEFGAEPVYAVRNVDCVDLVSCSRFFGGRNMGTIDDKTFKFININIGEITGTTSQHTSKEKKNVNRIVHMENPVEMFTENYTLNFTNLYVDGEAITNASQVLVVNNWRNIITF